MHLGGKVAIKTLPEEFAQDEGRPRKRDHFRSAEKNRQFFLDFGPSFSIMCVMKPTTTAMSGPLKGMGFQLSGKMTLGRDEANMIFINDDKISRYHLIFSVQDGYTELEDLNSTNGTFVNGVPVSKKILEHGDILKLGLSTFRYSEHDESINTAPTYDDEVLDTTRKARTVLNYSIQNEYPNTDQIQENILQHVFHVIPAKRAAILLAGRDSSEFVSGTYRVPSRASGTPFKISRLIAQKVLKGGLPSSTSGQESILCMPLTIGETKLGVIYVDNEGEFLPPIGFTDEHVGLLKDIADIGAAAFRNTLYIEWLQGENQRMKDEIGVDHDMIGDSPKMHEMYQIIGKVGLAGSNVLIAGESGTGKELVARAIHRNSNRRTGPFVAINCGAIAVTLLESELFGSEKGSYTGSVAQQKGKIEAAEGGTLFLDEIGDISMELQIALLRFLQEKTFQRVGGTRTIKLDVRIVVATNRNLEEAVRTGKFRKDLFYRLAVSIKVPALRDRRDDIPMLAKYFLERFSQYRRVAGITPDAMELMLSYDWPGNVRELENAIERAIVLGNSEHIRPDDLPECLTERRVEGPIQDRNFFAVVNRAKVSAIREMLDECNNDNVLAAQRLGISHSYLRRLMRNFRIDT